MCVSATTAPVSQLRIQTHRVFFSRVVSCFQSVRECRQRTRGSWKQSKTRTAVLGETIETLRGYWRGRPGGHSNMREKDDECVCVRCTCFGIYDCLFVMESYRLGAHADCGWMSFYSVWERKIILTTNAPALFMKMVNQIEPLQSSKIFHSRIKFASLLFAFIFVFSVRDITWWRHSKIHSCFISILFSLGSRERESEMFTGGWVAGSYFRQI